IKIDYSGKVFLYLENHLFHKMDEKEGIILYVKRIGPAEGDYFIDASKIMGILHRVSSEDIENNREEGSIIVKLAHISSIAKQIREAEKSENYELAAKLRDQQKRKKF
ncbi:hypothetical protein COT60_00795, partial [Candidatus Pacearchaeota archaeon CG09_land_8_20_14_0_10_30_9]